jgi:hypothetical protein
MGRVVQPLCVRRLVPAVTAALARDVVGTRGGVATHRYINYLVARVLLKGHLEVRRDELLG